MPFASPYPAAHRAVPAAPAPAGGWPHAVPLMEAAVPALAAVSPVIAAPEPNDAPAAQASSPPGPDIASAPADAPLPAGPTPAGALRRAVVHCGGQSALASAIGVSQSHVWNWLSRRRVPAEHCPAIERATARAVRCEELRPDIDWAYLRAVCEELAAPAPAA